MDLYACDRKEQKEKLVPKTKEEKDFWKKVTLKRVL